MGLLSCGGARRSRLSKRPKALRIRIRVRVFVCLPSSRLAIVLDEMPVMSDSSLCDSFESILYLCSRFPSSCIVSESVEFWVIFISGNILLIKW